MNDLANEIARRQYALGEEKTLEEIFQRVAREVAKGEPKSKRKRWRERFERLMREGRFVPGGRVLAGAGTAHGSLLNCFVQGATRHPEGTLEGIMEVARKLAVVTKVGGGNGVNLDAIPPAQRGLTVEFPRPLALLRGDHRDAKKFITGDYPPRDPAQPEARSAYDGRMFDRAVYGPVSPELADLARANGVGVLEERPEDVLEVPDDMGKIIDTAAEVVRRALAGRGTAVDFSALRPEGAPVRRSGGPASGPVSFLAEIYDNFVYWAQKGGPEAGPVATLRYVYAPILRAVRQGGVRRGAGMATLHWRHPDVLDFLTAKDPDRERAEGDIATFNVSILADDDLFQGEAVDAGYLQPVPGKYDEVPPLEDVRPWLLEEIAQHAWASGEPGMIFIDRVNRRSPLQNAGERWEIRATNPCGEIPLAKGEACNLGAMVLPRYVDASGGFDIEAFTADVKTAVRFLDDVLEVTTFELEDNREALRQTRRLGLGVMGLADMLIRMGLRYDSPEAVRAVGNIIDAMRRAALEASEELGRERGVFPLYQVQPEAFTSLGIQPRRNAAILTVAPTGTTSMLMGVSSGIEPVFAAFVWRRIGGEYKALIHPLFRELMEQHPPHPEWEKDGGWDWERLVEALQTSHGSVQNLAFVPEEVRRVFVVAHDIAPAAHLEMQDAVQRAFDAEGYAGNAISKTVNLPREASPEDVLELLRRAHASAVKGVTVYRDGSREAQVLVTQKAREEETSVPEVPETTAPREPVYPRPLRLEGHTDMVKLTNGDGKQHSYLVTVNYTQGHPIEVILTTGKAGDEANADSEALGRVVSIALQYGVPPEAIIKTLRGINGGLYGNYHKRFVASKADLIAVALELALEGDAPAQNPAPPAPQVKTPAPATGGETCPECGGPVVVQDGCRTCQACGWSKCG